MNTYYVARIDTNQYAGNFEREMVAFITGVYGDCGVGKRVAGQALGTLSRSEITWFQNHVLQTADEHGVRRPAEIVPTPGWHNDGHGNNVRGTGQYPAYQSVQMRFDVQPPGHILDIIRDRANRFSTEAIGLLFGPYDDLKIMSVFFMKAEEQTTYTFL